MIKNQKNKYLAKNTLLFSIGNFGTRIINFFLVPLYTNILTTAEYGTIDLLHVICTFAIPLLTLNISEAIMRFSMDKESDKSKILSIGILMAFISLILIFLLMPFLNFFASTKNYCLLIAIYIVTNATSDIFLYYIRGIEKLMTYSIISILQSLSIVGFNIIFLIVFKKNIEGYLLSYILSFIITIVLCFVFGDIINNIKNFRIDNKLFKKMLKYSILLIPNSLMWWIINFLDRIMISSLIGVDANGIYAVSYKIPTILTALTTIFNQAWMFSAVKEIDSHDKDEYTNSVYNGLFIVVTAIAAFLMIILKPLLSVYVGKEFFSAWKYTPPLLLGTVFLTLGTFLSNEYTAHKDSIGFFKSSSIGALFNIILNFILIKPLGILGVAIATLISYIVVFAFRVYDTKKYVKIQFYSKKRLLTIISLFLISLLTYSELKISHIILIVSLILIIIINIDFWKILIINCLKILKKGDSK